MGKFILFPRGREKVIMEIIIRKFSPIFIPRYEEISNQLPPFQLGCSRDPFSYYTYRKEFPTLSIRVYNFSFRTSFACFTLFFPSNPFPRPPSVRFTVKIHPPPLLPPGIHPGLLARQVENPNEILKVWDLIFKSVYLTFVCSCNATRKGYIANESENTNEINRNERVILFPLWLNWYYTDGESFFSFNDSSFIIYLRVFNTNCEFYEIQSIISDEILSIHCNETKS